MLTLDRSLLLLQDLDDAARTSQLADAELRALRGVADWIRTFVARPHKDLGRAGPVCAFVPGACERRTLWLAPERIAGRSVAELVELVNDYKQQLLRAQPVEGEATSYKALVVVFTDVSAERVKETMDDAQVQELKRRSYAEDGVVMGEFHKKNEGTAVHNPGFRPFQSPVPFLLMRHAIVNDWVFFLDNEEWLRLWARGFGGSAVQALAAALRRTDWRHQ